jgi:hypothetical protein
MVDVSAGLQDNRRRRKQSSLVMFILTGAVAVFDYCIAKSNSITIECL